MRALRTGPVALAPAIGVCLAIAVFVRALDQGASQVYSFQRAAGVLAVAGVAFVALLARPAWTLSIGVVLTAFSGHWDLIGLPFAADRLVLGAGVAGVLWQELRRPDRRLRTEPVHWLLAVASLYALTSSVVVGTITDDKPLFVLLDRFAVVPFLLFIVAPYAFPTWRERRVLLGTLVVMGGYLGLMSVFEKIGPHALVVPDYILDPSVGTHADRARGPFLEAVGNGLVQYSCGVAAVIAVITWRDRRLRVLAGLVAALCAFGILLTVTRAAWIAAVAGAAISLAAAPQIRRFVIPAALLGVAGVLCAFALVPGLQGQSQQRTDAKGPLWDRQNSNAAAERMIQRRPLFGFGWGRFTQDSVDYYRQAPDYPMTLIPDVHNQVLSNAAELGLVGGVLWAFAWLAALGGTILRRGPPDLYPWRIGLIGIAISWLVAANTSPSAFVMPALVLWTWAGVVRGLPEPSRREAATAVAVRHRAQPALSR